MSDAPTLEEPALMAPAVDARVAVRRLTLTRFRCYGQARIETDARPVVLTGPNGAGKTNLLEALSFLAPGRGLRRARLSEIDQRGAPDPAEVQPWAVAATISAPGGTVDLGTGREPTGDGAERRAVRIDGQPVRGQGTLTRHVSFVWLTPQMDRLFLEGSSARRRFLDRLVYGFDPGHASEVAAYEHSLRERARLLRDGPADAKWLGALEESMARHAVAIAAARLDVVQRLDAACARRPGPFPRARLAVQGTVESWLGQMPALAAEDRLRAALAAARGADGESATIGTHRSDFVVRFAPGPDAPSIDPDGTPAAQCSTGEQKALLIAILLSQARLLAELRGALPVLLLDEVTAHLDAGRRAALFAELLDLGTQAWLTGTDDALFSTLRRDAQFFTIRQAEIAPS